MGVNPRYMDVKLSCQCTGYNGQAGCESGSGCFQLGVGPSRGLFLGYSTSNFVKVHLKL